jgi:hypothetical protein
VSTKLQAVLKIKPEFSAFASVCQILHGDDVDPREHIAPEKIPLLKHAPMTFCDVVRSFSAYKRIMSDKRQ